MLIYYERGDYMDDTSIKIRFEQIYDATYRHLSAYVLSKIKNTNYSDDVLQIIYISFYKRLLKIGDLPEVDALKILKTAAKHEIGRYYGFIKLHQQNIPIFSNDEIEYMEDSVLIDTSLIGQANDKIAYATSYFKYEYYYYYSLIVCTFVNWSKFDNSFAKNSIILKCLKIFSV
jgi:hypothetical protein